MPCTCPCPRSCPWSSCPSPDAVYALVRCVCRDSHLHHTNLSGCYSPASANIVPLQGSIVKCSCICACMVSSHAVHAVPAAVFDTYTYSDVGFEGDACPPCIVMQPPVATLQTWMDAQNRSNLVWEEQVCLPVTLLAICHHAC